MDRISRAISNMSNQEITADCNIQKRSFIASRHNSLEGTPMNRFRHKSPEIENPKFHMPEMPKINLSNLNN